MEQSQGTIHIVGAGPGSPGLLTLRGAECLQQADVVLYDRLAHPALLLHAPKDAKLIYCGKKPCAHTLRQETIQQEMIVHARRGKKVVRLKGGDPAIFGRVTEEMEDLKKRGIPYEIVPGITAASAASSYAGAALTDRRYAHGFRVLTGHGQGPSGETAADWENLAATSDTLIWYMGVKRLDFITSRLMEYGKDRDTEVLIVEWASHHRQRTVSGPLHAISAKAAEQNITNPSVIFVGNAAGHHQDCQWFHPSAAGGILAFPQSSAEGAVYEQLKTEGMDVYIHSVISEYFHESENTKIIMNRLLEEGFIRHMVFPSTKEGQQLYEDCLKNRTAKAQPLTCWMTATGGISSTFTPMLPLLPLESPQNWPGIFLTDEHKTTAASDTKATM
ncbi:uroporphyrinogen-III C-methyltransferase [Salibacterium halotolerans]|uniref:Uroporphyrinogen-III C-methyltransferase n=1 Tax=Salibacterium halotolerans TaxID=1884432 RepID=A0A1I5TW82_9BACI|nr:uroporphyrinogen-III C-methyltransferase [Salibacterium halotolerans]SFP87303.1 uroporphyrinogen III methyltransferase / synthase [Salibacterium halotolerans]